MKKIFSIILSIILITMSAAATYAKKTTPIERRQIETRILNTTNQMQVMFAVANTLQDSNFIVEEFEPEIGHIRARKLFKQRYINKGRLAGQSTLLALTTSYAVFTWGSTAAYTYAPARKITDELHAKNIVIDTNVLIEPYGKKTKVRIILVQKILQNAEGFSYTKNATLKANRIYDKKVYEEFFNQLEDKLSPKKEGVIQ